MSPKERPIPPRPLATSTAERLTTIVEAAERAAAAVIDDAEREARRYLEEAQTETDRIVSERLASLSDLTDSLVNQAEAIRLRSDRLLSSLEEASPQVEEVAPPQPEPPAPQAPPPAPEPPVQFEPPPVFEPAPAPEPELPPRGSHLSAVSPPPVEPLQEAPPVVEQPPVEVPPPLEETPPEPVATPSGGSQAGARLLATQMAVSGSSRQEIETRLRTGFEIEDTTPILDAILGPEA